MQEKDRVLTKGPKNDHISSNIAPCAKENRKSLVKGNKDARKRGGK